MIFGQQNGFDASIAIESLNGQNGFSLFGADYSGATDISSVSGAGDINGDGLDDLLIGASSADPYGLQNTGQSYVLFGSTDFGNANNATVPVPSILFLFASGLLMLCYRNKCQRAVVVA